MRSTDSKINNLTLDHLAFSFNRIGKSGMVFEEMKRVIKSMSKATKKPTKPKPSEVIEQLRKDLLCQEEVIRELRYPTNACQGLQESPAAAVTATRELVQVNSYLEELILCATNLSNQHQENKDKQAQLRLRRSELLRDIDKFTASPA